MTAVFPRAPRAAAMTDAPSAELLARYRQNDPAAAEELFRRYAERLTRLARSRLSRKLSARLDPEDVVLSAYRSFFLLARDGVALRQSGDLWRLLARITLRKVCRGARRHRAGCRSVEREQEAEAAVLARGPTPAEAATLTDELRAVLSPLGPVPRRIAELRLQGHEVDEIAADVKRSPRTVRRTLAWLAEELERRLRDATPEEETAGAEGIATVRYGDIVLERQLGEGGMGKVYRARRRGGGPVAVKLLRKPLRSHAPAAARFQHEAALLARLRHPGIVAVRGLGRLPDGGHFLVMDLVEGSDLARRETATVAEGLGWVADAADAVEHAHRQGIVHCDLKPSNLLLDRDGRVRVTDFGLARSFADEDLPVGGTPGFMAPEQLDPAVGPISPRTDVFGLGAVLRTLLAGRRDVPAAVDAICRRCLAPEPEGRFASAAELAAALRSLGRDLPR